MDEFAMGSSTETSAFYPTLNPINHEYAPGGSSGGSAACVRMGFSPVSLGTDTGGSIRQPASFCGVVGIRPTYGFVSRFGMISFCSTLDQIGPIASNVEDAFTMLQVISGHDSSDSTSSLEEWDTIPCERKINSFATATCIEKLDMDPTVKKNL